MASGMSLGSPAILCRAVSVAGLELAGADMTDTTNGWPGEHGVPMNPEKDGWHWVRRIDEKQAHIQRWIGGQFWLSPSFGGPKTDMANYEYLGPVLTPDEATALQARVAELEGAQGRLILSFRLNILRLNPKLSHETISKAIEVALTGGKDE